ncbi:ABC transporter permease subunit [Paenibacillus chitinolyticus]|uniref:ABC transporter permease n=1 Tax=Paenibacillus chitinolyticus TaxID=79263 RepID=UPI002DB7EC72|nr:ABC transporter permease subunit [Paenibacillus chitinolyticus]MEC0244314.1 ABC transporter permease subunit [Paenibacillus chitinolyticus]
MNTFCVLVKKEGVQMIRELKVIWLPVVFILLGMTQPIMTHYLPSILGALGSGKGITIDPILAAQKGGEVLAGTLGSQFDQLGLIILAVSMMGIIQTEKANGMLAFILTRPVTVRTYLAGKIITNYLMAAFAVAVGYFVSYLYVNFLFTKVPFSQMVTALLLYLVWICFVTSFIAMLSTLFNSQSMIAVTAIVLLIGSRIMAGISPVIDFINPASMGKLAMELLIAGSIPPRAMEHTLVTLVWIALILFATNHWISGNKITSD